MSNDRTPAPGSAEEIFLARLADVSPIAESTEQVHLAAAIAAVREADVTAKPSRRTALRPTVPLWRKPRMALSNLAAIIAGLSLPMKAAAASTVAVAAIGGGVAVTNTPPEDAPPAAAVEGLDNAEENSGIEELPARGEPVRDEELETTVEDDELEAQEEHENNGLNDEVLDEDPENRSEPGKARAAANRAAAQERAAEEAEQAEARKEAAAERRAEAEARADAEAEAEARADAEERRTQARDNAATSDDDDDDDEVNTEETTEEESSTGTDRSETGRAKADGAAGR